MSLGVLLAVAVSASAAPFGTLTGQGGADGELAGVPGELAREASPEYLATRKRLRELERSIREVQRRFGEGKLGRDAARRQLRPLLEEKREIEGSLDYQVEQALLEARLASPAARTKLEQAARNRR